MDAVTGAALVLGTVTVRDTYGNVALAAPLGAPFTYTFAGRRVRYFDIDTHRMTSETVWPSVQLQLGAPYGNIEVDTGQA